MVVVEVACLRGLEVVTEREGARAMAIGMVYYKKRYISWLV